MTDKEFLKERTRVSKALKKWAYVLGFAHWNLSFIYGREPFKQPADGSFETKMTTEVKWEYMTVVIRVALSTTHYLPDIDLERMIIHEFAHALINEMHAVAKDSDHEERVAEQVMMAIWWAYRFGQGKFKVDKINPQEVDRI